MEDALRPRAACIVAAVLLLAPFALSAPTRPAAAVGAPAGGAAATPWTADSDFNGDGHSDLAASTLDRVAGQRFAGSVVILYGSPHGLTVRRNRVFTANTPGVKVRPHAGDGFGNALAAGDFNGDGRNDLAI